MTDTTEPNGDRDRPSDREAAKNPRGPAMGPPEGTASSGSTSPPLDMARLRELAKEFGFYPATTNPGDIERHRRLNAAVDAASAHGYRYAISFRHNGWSLMPKSLDAHRDSGAGGIPCHGNQPATAPQADQQGRGSQRLMLARTPSRRIHDMTSLYGHRDKSTAGDPRAPGRRRAVIACRCTLDHARGPGLVSAAHPATAGSATRLRRWVPRLFGAGHGIGPGR
jgi:hypothetical protein